MSGHWQYRILSFGLHGAPETFQKLMDIMLHPHYKYAAAHLDDVIIHLGQTPATPKIHPTGAEEGWAHC